MTENIHTHEATFILNRPTRKDMETIKGGIRKTLDKFYIINYDDVSPDVEIIYSKITTDEIEAIAKILTGKSIECKEVRCNIKNTFSKEYSEWRIERVGDLNVKMVCSKLLARQDEVKGPVVKEHCAYTIAIKHRDDGFHFVSASTRQGLTVSGWNDRVISAMKATRRARYADCARKLVCRAMILRFCVIIQTRKPSESRGRASITM